MKQTCNFDHAKIELHKILNMPKITGFKFVLVTLLFAIFSMYFLPSFSQVPFFPNKVPFTPNIWNPIFKVPADTSQSNYFFSGYTIKMGSDIDQDGKKEIISFDTSDKTIKMWENVDNHTYEYIWSYKISHLVSDNVALVVSDLNNNGRDELIVVADREIEYDGVLIYEWDGFSDNGFGNQGEMTYSFDPVRDKNGRIVPSPECLSDDFDNDGRQELLILYRGGTNILLSMYSFLDSEWSPFSIIFTDFIDTLNTTKLKAAGIGVGDIDQNGSKEIVVVCEGQRAPIRLYTSLIPDSFSLVNQWSNQDLPNDYIGSSSNIPIVDFNNDGLMEAYLFSNAGYADTLKVNAQVWVIQLGQDLFNTFNAENFTRIEELDATNLRGGVVEDGDSDGKPDLFVVGTNSRALYQIEYKGKAESDITAGSKYSAYRIVQDPILTSLVPTNISDVIDLDNDGRKEIAIIRGKSSLPNPILNLAGQSETNTLSVHESTEHKDSRPAPPSELKAQILPGDSVELSWKDNSDKEKNFKVFLAGAEVNPNIEQDARQYNYKPTTLPGQTAEYQICASNDAGESAFSNPATLINASGEQWITHQYAGHPYGLVIGNQGGSDLGWSDFLIPIPGTNPVSYQDIIYDGYLLVLSQKNNSSTVYVGENNDFSEPTGIYCHQAETSNLVWYEYTSQSANSNEPVSFKIESAGLIIKQRTIHVLSKKWVLVCWRVQNTDSAPQRVKLALHIDADAGGLFSIRDIGNYIDQPLKLLYQQNEEREQIIGMALIDGDFERVAINSYSSNFKNNRKNLLELENAPGLFKIPNDLDLNSANDLEMTMICDFETILSNNESEMAIFVIAAAADYSELKAEIESAQYFVSSELQNKNLGGGYNDLPAPSEPILYQNYPNPSNPGTVIEYKLHETSFVTLEIFNLLGHRVQTLVSQRQTAGYYLVRWDGNNSSGTEMASGFYIYRLKTDNYAKSKKLLKIK